MLAVKKSEHSTITPMPKKKAAKRKDPYCCLSDKIDACLDGFDHGGLTACRSIRYAVAQLSRQDALKVIDAQITDLEARTNGSKPVATMHVARADALEYIQIHDSSSGLTVKQYANARKLPPSTASGRIQRLVETGYVSKISRGRYRAHERRKVDF